MAEGPTDAPSTPPTSLIGPSAHLPCHPCQVVLCADVPREDHVGETRRARLRATTPNGHPGHHRSQDLGPANAQGTHGHVVGGDATFGHEERRRRGAGQQALDDGAESVVHTCPDVEPASAVILQHLAAGEEHRGAALCQHRSDLSGGPRLLSRGRRVAAARQDLHGELHRREPGTLFAEHRELVGGLADVGADNYEPCPATFGAQLRGREQRPRGDGGPGRDECPS
mmetsp:Transcript_2105/g.5166  ORF Transcript_2105/g.5166 Transcript_2105/m.5166 type:complete len:227 (-) Transcript_2105:987-1667(-)